MAGFRRKCIMCPTCKEATQHRTFVDAGLWTVDECVICGSQWRKPWAKPSPPRNTGHKDYNYE